MKVCLQVGRLSELASLRLAGSCSLVAFLTVKSHKLAVRDPSDNAWRERGRTRVTNGNESEDHRKILEEACIPIVAVTPCPGNAAL